MDTFIQVYVGQLQTGVHTVKLIAPFHSPLDF